MRADTVEAPWTAEQVAQLNRFQSYGFVHPFTCPDGNNLVATLNGWVCPCCDYRQNWAWRAMFEPMKNPLES